MPTLKIEKIVADEFKSFIKKLLSIDKFIFMKITNESVTSAVFLPQRDSVKLLSIPLKDMFVLDKPLSEPVRVTFYNANKIIDALSYFTGDIKAKIQYTQSDEGLIATDFIIFNDKLTIKLLCADQELAFMDMSKEDLAKVFNYKDYAWSFDIKADHVSEMKDLHALDKDRDKYKLRIKDDKLFVIGENYESLWVDALEIVNAEIKEVTIYKKYLPIIDKEAYSVFLCSNKMIFKSKDKTNVNLICIALCQTSDDLEDEDINKAVDDLDDIPF